MSDPFGCAAAIITGQSQLPVMPQVASQIFATVGDEDVELSEVAQIIGQDPAICARLLALANSALFAQTKEIHQLEEAIIRVLGLDLASGVAIGMACSATFDMSRCQNFDSHQFWQNSLNTSAFTKQIALKAPEALYPLPLAALAGLLFDIGSLALAAFEPVRMNTILANSPENLREALLLEFGCHQAHLSYALAQRWDFPDALQSAFAASAHHPAGQPPNDTTLYAQLWLAKHLLEEDEYMADDKQQLGRLLTNLGLSNGPSFNQDRIKQTSTATAAFLV